MPKRLDELFQPGDSCQVYFAANDSWYDAVVLSFQHPGCWVQAVDGSLWFVTNTRRIRKLDSDELAGQE